MTVPGQSLPVTFQVASPGVVTPVPQENETDLQPQWLYTDRGRAHFLLQGVSKAVGRMGERGVPPGLPEPEPEPQLLPGGVGGRPSPASQW